jgi:hypothetical protein
MESPSHDRGTNHYANDRKGTMPTFIVDKSPDCQSASPKPRFCKIFDSQRRLIRPGTRFKCGSTFRTLYLKLSLNSVDRYRVSRDLGLNILEQWKAQTAADQWMSSAKTAVLSLINSLEGV